jgi:hypothetical protein
LLQPVIHPVKHILPPEEMRLKYPDITLLRPSKFQDYIVQAVTNNEPAQNMINPHAGVAELQ